MGVVSGGFKWSFGAPEKSREGGFNRVFIWLCVVFVGYAQLENGIGKVGGDFMFGQTWDDVNGSCHQKLEAIIGVH